MRWQRRHQVRPSVGVPMIAPEPAFSTLPKRSPFADSILCLLTKPPGRTSGETKGIFQRCPSSWVVYYRQCGSNTLPVPEEKLSNVRGDQIRREVSTLLIHLFTWSYV